MEGSGSVIAKPAPNFSLRNQDGEIVELKKACAKGPVMLVFYPGDFTPVCTKQMCNYRDSFEEFKKFGVQIFGISANSGIEHQRFSADYMIPFPLLSDPGKEIAKLYDCTSFLMMGMVSRAVFIISQKQFILYRYVEPTVLTRRKADELVGILTDLRKHKLI